MRCLLLACLVGCDFGASTKVDGSDTGAFTGFDDDSGTGSDNTDDTADEVDDPNESDDDGDGYTENEGDCDDANESIYPGQTDVCDGADNDCDGEIDEDSVDEDEYEPNDTLDYPIGSIDDAGEIRLEGFLHNESDIDRFRFSLTDGWFDFFTLRVQLLNLSGDITYKLVVRNVDDDSILFEGFNSTGDDSILFESDEGFGASDSGQYRITVSSLGGSGCMDPYLLTVEKDELL
ncbi:MAG: putative metal-binding motif-containing protein [Myxococcota bacterium]